MVPPTPENGVAFVSANHILINLGTLATRWPSVDKEQFTHIARNITKGEELKANAAPALRFPASYTNDLAPSSTNTHIVLQQLAVSDTPYG